MRITAGGVPIDVDGFEYSELKRRPKDETREERTDRYWKVVRKWAEKAALEEARRAGQGLRRHG